MAIDIMHAFETEPPVLDFIWSGGFLAGTVGSLVAPGATGKSFWALQAAMAVAGCIPEEGLFDADLLGLRPMKRGRVLYIAGEDPEPALHHRIHAIGAHLSDEAKNLIAEHLRLEAVMGARLDIMHEAHVDRIIEAAAGYRLIVMDTLSRIHTLDENDNGDMARLLAQLEFVAKHTGASVLFLHHVSKSSARDGLADQQQAARGASALVDNSRWCAYVSKMAPSEAETLSERTNGLPIGERRDFFVRYGISKQNYASPTEPVWYQRAERGVLLPAELFEAERKRNNGRNRGVSDE